MIGTAELAVVGGAIVLLFGASKIPELARSMGEAKSEFKKGIRGEDTGAPEGDTGREEKKE